MNFTDLGVLGLVIFAATDFFKPIIPETWPSNVTQVLAGGIAVGSTFLVGATVWAPEVVAGGHKLSDVNGASKVVIGILAMGIATGIDRLTLIASRTRRDGKTPANPAPHA